MSEDAWIDELAEAARDEEEAERAEVDERWIRLSAGAATAEEEAELRALAVASPEAREAYEAFRPLSPEFRARTRQVLRERLAAGGDPPAVLNAPSTPPTGRSGSRPPRAGWTPRFAGWLAAAAAAFTILTLWLGPFRARLGPWVMAGELSTGDLVERSAAPAPALAVYHPGSRFSVALAPQAEGRRCEPSLVAECYLAGSSELRPWSGCAAQAKFEPCGTRGLIAGTVGETLPLEPGDWKLWVVIGRREQLPGADDLNALLGDPVRPCPKVSPTRGRSWSAVCVQPLRMENGP